MKNTRIKLKLHEIIQCIGVNEVDYPAMMRKLSNLLFMIAEHMDEKEKQNGTL